MRTLPALAVAALLVAAGCAAPVTDDARTAPRSAASTDGGPGAGDGAATTATTTAPATPEPRQRGQVRVRGLALPEGVDAGVLFKRVLTVRNVTADGPTVVVKRRPDRGAASGAFSPSDSFATVVGIEPPDDGDGDGNGSDGDDGGLQAAGLTQGATVYLYLRDSPPGAVERTLVHEYAHVVQYRTGAFDALGEASIAGNRDRIVRAVVEGAARYVEHSYARRYQGTDPAPNATAWARAPAYVKYGAAPYYYGERYVAARVDSPANLSVVYERPPRTTEQLLHGDAPGTEPVRPLDAAGAPDDRWQWRDAATKGELFLRVALDAGLPYDRARAASTGWGADRLLTFADREGDATGYAWAVRWDDAGEAREYERALRDYLDARGDRTGDGWRVDDHAFRVEAVGDETVVLLAGAPAFVDGATVSGADATVTVDP